MIKYRLHQWSVSGWQGLCCFESKEAALDAVKTLNAKWKAEFFFDIKEEQAIPVTEIKEK